ncbi:hypothetical protein CBL_08693 [Carabus blaptoides fortunei]
MAVYKIKISVKHDQLHKTNCENEINAALKRNYLFGWLPEEYRKRKKELNQVSADWPVSEMTSKLHDERSLKPVPPTSNGVIGWLASKKDFQLEKYGPDIMKFPPLPTEEF